ncbi:hypothetical protein F9K33_03700 [bacterium]|nr:MAG: hypothetical protein F9K33_03700 [bacterium]
MKTMLLSLLLLISVSINSRAQDQSAGRVHGYVFGDYYYKFGGEKAKAVSTTQYADSALTKSGAFQLRRIYLYYEHAISETFQAQFLLEGNDGATDGKGRHSVYIKLVNLEWKNILPDQNLALGMIGTPTWAISEKVWGYRAIEKTITDMRGLGGASDIGITMKGSFGNEGMFGYAVMVGNGNGQKPENNKSRKYYGSFSVKPIKGLIVEAYGDFESDITEPKKTFKTSQNTTIKGLAGYQTDKFSVGLETVKQIQEYTDTTNITPLGISLFASAPLIKDKLNAYARFDTYDPNTKNSKAGYKENFITAGIDFVAHKSVHIMPNIWVNTFSKKGSTSNRKADTAARVTFFYVYK